MQDKKEYKKADKKADKRASYRQFLLRTAGYFSMMMALYLYYMLASLSSAPKFVYTQF